jgi:hypothetical protein
MKTMRVDGMLGFQPYFDIRQNLDGTVVGPTRRPHFTPKEIPRYSLLLQAVWTSCSEFGQNEYVT